MTLLLSHLTICQRRGRASQRLTESPSGGPTRVRYPIDALVADGDMVAVA